MSYNRHYPFDEKKHERWLKEGRGRGEGALYRSWLTAADVPATHGHKDRFKCAFSGRTDVTFSSIEKNARMYFEVANGVENIYGQFPLDREATRAIAKSLGIQHPRDPATLTDIVMTTDLVVMRRNANGPVETHPRSCKADSNLKDFNQAEHAEIERRYWKEKGCKWRFLTNSYHCQPQQLIANVTLLHNMRFPPATEAFVGQFELLCRGLIEGLRAACQSNQTLTQFAAEYDVHHGLHAGEATSALLYLIFHRRLRVDLGGGDIRAQSVNAIVHASQKANTQ